MIKLFVSALATLAFAGNPCSTLTVTGTGAPGTNIVFTLDGGAANAPALMAMGQTTGSITFNFGQLGSLELGVLPPFTVLPLGTTDANGDASLTVRVPNIPGVNMHGQGFTVDLQIVRGRPSLQFCTSNVAAFRIGGS